MARPTQSRALWRQMVGRGMRTAMDKAECLVLDHAGNALKFGSPNERDTYDLHAPARKKRSRRDADPRPSLVVCPHCRAVNERRARACVGCGAVLAIAVRERAELELQVLGVGGELERLRYFQRCLRQCRTSGKACKMYQIHRGAWPDAWMKVACGVYWEIHGRDPADGLVNFTQKKLAELRDAEHAAA